MTGSVIDGEDVVQEALIKAIEALPDAGPIAHPEGWLFRIAHNAALDFLRRRARRDGARSDEDPDMLVDPANAADDRQIATASLRTFMRLPVAQRSCVILMDVLGYSLEEIGDVIDSSIPAVKAALNRGRARLRELAQEPDDRPLPVLAEPRALVAGRLCRPFQRPRFRRDPRHARRRSAARTGQQDPHEWQGRGRQIFQQLRAGAGLAARSGIRRPTPGDSGARSRDASGAPAYFVLLDWAGGQLIRIIDFRYARYATEGAEILMLD